MKTTISIIIIFIAVNVFGQTRNWVATTSSSANFSDDRAIKIVTDGNGNSYVTGQCFSCTLCTGLIGTAKYNSSGVQQWFVEYSDLNSSNDSATGIAIDVEGNIYVCGKHFNGNNFDYIVLKYGSTGRLLWHNFYSGSGNGDDIATGVAVENDPATNKAKYVYVTGYSNENHVYGAINYDMVTIKYNAQNGTFIWANHFDAPDEPNINVTGHGDDKAFAIAIAPETQPDAVGAVYICGYSFHTYQWSGQTISKNNNILVQINILTGDTASGDTALFSYYNEADVTANGTTITDVGLAIAVSQNFKKVYELGYKHKDSVNWSNTDLFLIQNAKGLHYPCHQCEDWCASFVNDLFDTSRNRCYKNTFKDYGDDAGYNLVVQDGVNSASEILIYVCGSTQSQFNGLDFITIRYHGSSSSPSGCDPDDYPYDFINGRPAVVTYNGSSNLDDVVHGITIGTNGYVYVTGTSTEINNITNVKRFTVIKYDSNLVQQWVDHYPRSTDSTNSNNNSEGFSITSDATGIYATGYSFSSTTGNDFTTISYANSPLRPNSNTKSLVNKIIFENKLYQNYPNPFNPTTEIKFSVRSAGNVEIKIYDILGRLVATLLNQPMEAGEHSVNWNASTYASGIYYYRINSRNYTETKKLLFVK